jgi:hypothetical protein
MNVSLSTHHRFPNPMKNYLASIAVLLLAHSAFAAAFTSGSTGADLALDVAANTTITLPARPSGIFHYTTIRVRQGGRLLFERNAANTPVTLLATGDVLIEGSIEATGQAGTAINGGLGGAGGFDGGKPGIAGGAPGAGYGPGGGKPGLNSNAANGAGGGAYATDQSTGLTVNKGIVYGTELLMPLIGGSGGGGMPDRGGGGGGGAILVASTTRITFSSSGSILAHGAASGWGYGSGGAIRLVSPIVAGNGSLSVSGNSLAGDGRVRIDVIDRSQFALQITPGTPRTLVVGGLMAVFPPVNPQLDIISVGGEAIAPGSQTPIFVRLPFGAPANQVIELRARDFNQSLPVTVALIPDSGPPSYYQTTINNVAANPSAPVAVTVNMPANVIVRVMAWTR